MSEAPAYTEEEYTAFRANALAKSLANFKYEYPEKLTPNLICSYMVVIPFGSIAPKKSRRKLFNIYHEYYKKLFDKAFIEAQKYLGPFNQSKLTWDIKGDCENSHEVVDAIMNYVHVCLTGVRLYREYMNDKPPISITSENIHDVIGDKQLSIFTHFSVKTTDGMNHTLEPTVALVATKYDETHAAKFSPVEVIEYITQPPKKD